MGAPKKADWREERRKQAWKLKEQGWPQKDIAVALGVSEGAVSHWMRTRARRRRRSPQSASAQRSEPTVNGTAEGSNPGVVSQRSPSVWLSRRGLDRQAG